MDNIIYKLEEIDRSLIQIKKTLRELVRIYEAKDIKEVENQVYLAELNLAGVISEITPT
jgi:hypothetical protein